MKLKHRLIFWMIIRYIRFRAWYERTWQRIDILVIFIEGPDFEFNFYWNWREDQRDQMSVDAQYMRDAWDSEAAWKCPSCEYVTMDRTLQRNGDVCNGCGLVFSMDTFKRME
jgi:hypothetical protein